MTLQRQRLAARVFDQAMRFSAFLQAWPQRLTPAPFRLLQIGSAFWQSRALHAAAQLDLANRHCIGNGVVIWTSSLKAAEIDVPTEAGRLLGEQYVRERPELFRADGSNVTSEASEPADSP